ncbi:MAG: hypothetical protein NVS2B12_04120 [Ktedonobacteraceae bacterium]
MRLLPVSYAIEVIWEVGVQVDMNKTSGVECVEEGRWVQIATPPQSASGKIPAYNSAAFWTFAGDIKTPLELLVKALRSDMLSTNKRGRDELFEIINRRVRRENELWAYWRLYSLQLSHGERQLFLPDLCADLDFAIYRSLIDKRRYHWEEDFSTSLGFERRRTFNWFLQHECFWKPGRVKQSIRVPRARLLSIDKMMHDVYRPHVSFDIEDERVQHMLARVELSDVRQCVLAMPERLKVVVWLMHWDGRSCQEIARLLHVSERTVRNRLQTAYTLLREVLEADFCYT